LKRNTQTHLGNSHAYTLLNMVKKETNWYLIVGMLKLFLLGLIASDKIMVLGQRKVQMIIGDIKRKKRLDIV